MSDYKGAALMVDALPQAKALLGDKGYDADWFRQALIARCITPCIPPKSNRKHPPAFDRVLYRSRHKIEICSENSRTGGASIPAMTAAHTPSSQPSVSLLSSSSGSINES